MADLNIEKIPCWANMTGPRRVDGEGKPKTYMTEHEAIHLVHGERELFIVGYATGYGGEDGNVAEMMPPEEFLAEYSLKQNP